MEKQQSLGALWVSATKDGKKYLSGEIAIDGQKTKIVVFKNNYKEEDKHPDYKIFQKIIPNDNTDKGWDNELPTIN